MSTQPRVVLDESVTSIITQQFPEFVRGEEGDMIVENHFKGYEWSALRILRSIPMERGADDGAVEIFGKEADRITASESLKAAESSYHRQSSTCHDHRLCPCQRHGELGWLAKKVGHGFSLPTVGGLSARNGPRELAMLRTFSLSPYRAYGVDLQFGLTDPIETFTVELTDRILPIKEEIESLGIVDNDEDETSGRSTSLEPGQDQRNGAEVGHPT